MSEFTPKHLTVSSKTPSSNKVITPSSPYRIDIPHTPSSVHKRPSSTTYKVKSSSSLVYNSNPSSPSISSIPDNETLPPQLFNTDTLADAQATTYIHAMQKLGAEPPCNQKEDDMCNSDCDSSVIKHSTNNNNNNNDNNKQNTRMYKYDSTVELEKPLPRRIRGLLEITEIPFMIMWVYLTYWIVITSLCAHKVKQTVWVSAAVAGLLVGIGLNANAYRMIIAKGRIDYGVVIRFFLIPFGVSSLSGMTNSLRDDFLLVFPRELSELVLSLCLPAIVISFIVVTRITLLWKLKVKLTFRSLFLNGTLSTQHVY